MAEIRRYSIAAVICLVVLRVGIGWQLLYEGLWKIDTLSSSSPWTSDGYLKSSQGPMRNIFRAMTGDPNDQAWLDEDAVVARWDTWKHRFARHYGLDEKQVGRLNQLVDGSSVYAATIATPPNTAAVNSVSSASGSAGTHPPSSAPSALPPGVDFKAARLDDVISFDAKTKRLTIDGKAHMLPAEKQTLEDQVADGEGPEYDGYRKALNDAFTRASRLSYKERLRAHLVGNPDNAGRIDGRISQLQLYNDMLGRYEQKLTSATMAFEFDHLNQTWSDARAKAMELAGPVRAMDAELRAEAMDDIVTVDQLKRGPLPEPWTILKIVDVLTITGLAALGILLIVGLFTRFTALSAALMVFGFYLAMPPLPGVPEAPGPEHSFIVNKNLVEVLALMALAFVPSGYWFGLDNIIARMFARKSRVTVAGK